MTISTFKSGLLDPPLWGSGSYSFTRIRQSISLSARVFLKILSFIFSDSLHEVRALQTLKTNETRFSLENSHFSRIASTGVRNEFFWSFMEIYQCYKSCVVFNIVVRCFGIFLRNPHQKSISFGISENF